MSTLFYKRLSEILKIYSLLLGVFLMFRIVFLCTYGNITEIFQNHRIVGDHIFDAANTNNTFVITQSSWAMEKTGCINLHSRQSFAWQNDSYYLKPVEATQELETMRRKSNAWLFGMKWQILFSIKKQEEQKDTENFNTAILL